MIFVSHPRRHGKTKMMKEFMEKMQEARKLTNEEALEEIDFKLNDSDMSTYSHTLDTGTGILTIESDYPVTYKSDGKVVLNPKASFRLVRINE